MTSSGASNEVATLLLVDPVYNRRLREVLDTDGE